MDQAQRLMTIEAPPSGAPERLPVVVVGSGPVGLRVVQELLRRDPHQPVILYGEEPWGPYNRVKLSSLLAGEVSWEEIERGMTLTPRPQLITRYHCRITAIDVAGRRVQDEYGHWQFYQRLVLALGSRPHVPFIPGIDLAGVYTLRDLSDAQKLFARQVRSRHTVVLGGGLLGLEAARAMQRFNTRVTVVEAFDRLMARQLDEEGAELLARRVMALGVEVILGDSVRQVLGVDGVSGVALSSGRVLEADTLVVATGIRPRVELAREAGLAVGQGIRVDDAMTTSDPHILAVGECAEHRGRVYGLVTPGLEQAAVAAHAVTAGPCRYNGSTPATRLKVLGCPVFSTGRVLEEDSLDLARQCRYRNADGTVYRKLVVKRGQLIGAVAVGEWSDLGRVQEAVDQRRRIWPWQWWRFVRTGSPWPEQELGGVAQWPPQAVVCNCTGVTRRQLGEALAGGCRGVEELAARSGASTVCGSCRPLLAELVGQPAAPEPVRWARPLLGGTLLALAATLLLLLAPSIPYPDTVQWSLRWDQLWRDGLLKQISGFTLVGLTVVGLGLSLNKRLPRLRLGPFDLWRLIHAGLGVVVLGVLLLHTGGRTGEQLNLWLNLSFLITALAGALAGGWIALEHRLEASRARLLRRRLVWLHILAVWPLPVLLTFHVLKGYYF